MRSKHLPRLANLVSFVAVAFLLSGCSLFDSPQNTFAPAGEVARDQKNLFFLTMWPALAILVLVEGLLLFILFRFRRKEGDTGLPPQVHGNNKLEIGWTIAPVILLAFFVPPTIGGIIDLGRQPKGAMEVDVTGIQWAWQFNYPAADGGTPAQSLNELHIPIGREVLFRLRSNDVIHSFWIPRLAGKTDVIPGRENHMWIKGTELGTFSAQCAEFCGIGHAKMRFTVTVESEQEFQSWLQQQQAATRDRTAGEPALATTGSN